MSDNYLLIGFGSMGKRRARLLAEIDATINIIVLDSSEERQKQAAEMGFSLCDNLEQAVATFNFKAALICSSPLSHPELTKKLLKAGISVFSELNLNDDGYPEMNRIAKENNVIWFNSNTMLYRREIRRIIDRRKEFAKPISYNYHIGQYLPDWHPWESYKNFFVGDNRTSGIREIFAIELAWLTSAFGDVKSFTVNKRRLSSLEIGYDDTVVTMLTHEDGTTGVLTADVVSPKAVRELEIFGEGLHLFWEGSPTTLFEYDVEKKEKQNLSLYEKATRLQGYSDNIVEEAYTDELLNFIAVLSFEEDALYSYEHNVKVLKLIEEIERR